MISVVAVYETDLPHLIVRYLPSTSCDSWDSGYWNWLLSVEPVVDMVSVGVGFLSPSLDSSSKLL